MLVLGYGWTGAALKRLLRLLILSSSGTARTISTHLLDHVAVESVLVESTRAFPSNWPVNSLFLKVMSWVRADWILHLFGEESHTCICDQNEQRACLHGFTGRSDTFPLLFIIPTYCRNLVTWQLHPKHHLDAEKKTLSWGFLTFPVRDTCFVEAGSYWWKKKQE